MPEGFECVIRLFSEDVGAQVKYGKQAQLILYAKPPKMNTN